MYMYVPDPNVENLPFDVLRRRLCFCRYFTSVFAFVVIAVAVSTHRLACSRC